MGIRTWLPTVSGKIPCVGSRSGRETLWKAMSSEMTVEDDRFADNLDTAGRKTGKEKDIPHVSFRDL
jgi:hypothetical protein